MEDAADTITYMVVAAVWCECRRKKCKGAVLIVSMSPQATAKMLMLFDACFSRVGYKLLCHGRNLLELCCYIGTPSFFLSILPDLVLTYLELQSGEFFWNSSLETGGPILRINHFATRSLTTDFDVQVTSWPVSHPGCCL